MTHLSTNKLGISGARTLNELAAGIGLRYPTGDYSFNTQDILINCDTCSYGCSITYGTGVLESERYTSLLTGKTNNFGIPGIGPDEMLMLFAATAKFVDMKQATFLFPSNLRCTVPLNGNFYNIFPTYSRANPGNKLIEDFGKIYYQLPDSYYDDKFRNQLAMIIYIAELKNIKLYLSSWVPEVYQILLESADRDNVVVVEPVHNDRKARDGLHPSRNVHAQIANNFNASFENL